MDNEFGQACSYNNINPKILGFYAGEINILDIGCSTGILAKKLKALNSQARIVGIDLVPLPKDNENSLDDFFIVDLDDQKLPKFDNKFDLIVLGDVLEHLKRPDIILKNLKELLASHGRIIISVPNIAQIKIRLKLLLGNFDYQDYGIMDRTHLKFFTQKTIKNLIIQAGYQIEREEFIFSKKLSFMGWVLRGSLLNIFYRLFSGQFIFKIRPSQ